MQGALSTPTGKSWRGGGFSTHRQKVRWKSSFARPPRGAFGQLAAASHTTSNLLTVIMSYSARRLDRLGAGENREAVQAIAQPPTGEAGLTSVLAFSPEVISHES